MKRLFQHEKLKNKKAHTGVDFDLVDDTNEEDIGERTEEPVEGFTEELTFEPEPVEAADQDMGIPEVEMTN
jgi:hypothetical protein